MFIFLSMDQLVVPPAWFSSLSLHKHEQADGQWILDSKDLKLLIQRSDMTLLWFQDS